MLKAGGMALVVGAVATSAGCRSMHKEVPPGKPYSTTGAGAGANPASVGFGSDPHPTSAAGNIGMYQNGMALGAGGPDGAQSMNAAAPGMLGTPAPNPGNYGQPTPGLYAKPGTAGTAGN
jgi:hypothetical protein